MSYLGRLLGFLGLIMYYCTACAPTPEKVCINQFTDDRDGEVYCMVTIGNQTWMADNLRYAADTSYINPNAPTDINTPHGRLYPYQQALVSCPTGWHLPTDDEWKELEANLGMSTTLLKKVGFRGSNEGTQLKGTVGWNTATGNPTSSNSQGFSALAAGRHNPSYGPYFDLGEKAFFWTATPYDTTGGAWARALSANETGIERLYYSQQMGYACRCLKN